MSENITNFTEYRLCNLSNSNCMPCKYIGPNLQPMLWTFSNHFHMQWTQTLELNVYNNGIDYRYKMLHSYRRRIDLFLNTMCKTDNVRDFRDYMYVPVALIIKHSSYSPWGCGSIHVCGGITCNNKTRIVFNRNVNAHVCVNEELADTAHAELLSHG